MESFPLDNNMQEPEQVSAPRSPIGRKEQRTLSLSAKWASDKGLAMEFLKRQEEVIRWLEGMLDRNFESSDLYQVLKSGVVLRELIEKIYPTSKGSSGANPISRNYSFRMAPWKERENISLFLRRCKAVGMNDLSLFCTDDLYEGTDMVQVLFCLQHFMAFTKTDDSVRSDQQDEARMRDFSNQEVEIALERISSSRLGAEKIQDFIAQPQAVELSETEDNIETSTVASQRSVRSNPTVEFSTVGSQGDPSEMLDKELGTDFSSNHSDQNTSEQGVLPKASEDDQDTNGNFSKNSVDTDVNAAMESMLVEVEQDGHHERSASERYALPENNESTQLKEGEEDNASIPLETSQISGHYILDRPATQVDGMNADYTGAGTRLQRSSDEEAVFKQVSNCSCGSKCAIM